MEENRKYNRLINEKSPYLFAHAQNPVDWYPWGEEAFERAKAEDKPVFLSVGYSTCHWCHVMAHESFENAELAELLNRGFVAVKVDREERPDVDAVYMEVCQALTGSGGWPMTIIMTAEKKPFFAGTYLPRTSRRGMTGLAELLTVVETRWRSSREELIDSGERITDFIKTREAVPFGPFRTARELALAARAGFGRSFDKVRGGFGSAPKFPMAHNLLFLLRYSALEKDDEALEMSERTLEQMYRGGIFDHIGGGFSRYSTDAKWLIPHFEKMLYDNALLAWAYTEAFVKTKRLLYRRVAEKTINYVLAELSLPSGGFLCGQDADSEGVEGKYYAFTPEELKGVLGETQGEEYCRRFGIQEAGNFEGKSVPNLLDCENYETEEPIISELTKKLYGYRLSRTHLNKDDKVLCSWNALMIIALARAGCVFHDEKYLSAAVKAAKFVFENLADEQGVLKIRWKDGQAAQDGQLDDYAFLGLACLELYRARFETFYLERAAKLAEKMDEFFLDEEGGYFMYSKRAEQLITRPKPIYDGAIFSGNSAAALLLTRLSRLTADKGHIESAERQLEFMAKTVSAQPSSSSLALLALMEAEYSTAELVCVSAENEAPSSISDLAAKAGGSLSVLLKTPQNAERLAEIAPFTAEYEIPQSDARYYLCRGRSCLRPAAKLEELEEELSEFV